MRKFLLKFVLIFAAVLCLVSCKEEVYDGVGYKDQTKWNIMIYLCGSTLEEDGGWGSYNLDEIAHTKPNEDVAVYIMTGGVRSEVDNEQKGWQNKAKVGDKQKYCDAVYNMNLSGSVDGHYQYWRYAADSSNEDGYGVFQELHGLGRGMDDGDTLTSFIKNCTEITPDRKTALVLWDHGGGLLGGLLNDCTEDTTPDKTVMSLNELGKAIEDSGQNLDLVVTDLCVMQSLETAITLCDNVSYLVGSQNSIYSYGLGYKDWLSYAYDNPKCSGLLLGKKICDAHVQKYASADNMDPCCTCSVVDLGYVQSLAMSFDCIYKKAYSYINSPAEMQKFVSVILNAQDFTNRMYDIDDASSLLYENGYITQDEYAEITEKLENAVVYNRTGSYCPKAAGLSFTFFLGNGLKTEDEVFDYIDNYTSQLMPNFYALMYTRYSESNKADYSLELSLTDDGKLSIPYSQRNLVSTVGVEHVLVPKDENSNAATINYSYYLLDEKSPDISSDLSHIEYGLLDDRNDTFMGLKGLHYDYSSIPMPSVYDFTVPIPMYQIMARRDSEGLYTRMLIPLKSSPYSGIAGYIAVIYDHSTKQYSAYVVGQSYSNDISRYSCLTDISNIGSYSWYLCSSDSDSEAVCKNASLALDLNGNLFDKVTLTSDNITALCGQNYKFGYRYIVYDTFGVANVSEIKYITE